MSSETITRNDLTNILNEVVAIDATDMTAQEIQDFVDSLNVTGINAVDYIVEQGTDGIWTYRKWNNGSYEAWYEGNMNIGTGSAMGGGYFHTSSSALTPPTFSTSVTSMTGACNGQVLLAYVGHDITTYQTYWWNGASTAANNVAVRLDMYGTWK